MTRIINAVIIDDEERAVSILRKLIGKTSPQVRVIGTAKSVEEGINCVDEKEPDLVFLDIYLPDGDGFEILELVDYKKFEVIFTTAFDKYALKAFEFAALDYLLKPIGVEKLKMAIKRYDKISKENNTLEQLSILKATLNNQFEKIALPSNEGCVIINLKDIVRCEAADKYTVMHMSDGRKVIVTKPLNILEKTLCELNFFRVHNQHLINLKHAVKFEKGKGGYVVLSDKKSINISIRRKKEFLVQLQNYARQI